MRVHPFLQVFLRQRLPIPVSYTHLDVYKRQEQVTKYHRTFTTYISVLLKKGFRLVDVEEPQPPEEMLDTVPGMKDEMRRPMMFLVSAQKEK